MNNVLAPPGLPAPSLKLHRQHQNREQGSGNRQAGEPAWPAGTGLTEACLLLPHSVPGTLTLVTRLVIDTKKKLHFTFGPWMDPCLLW